MILKLTADLEAAHKQALSARMHSHSPYSRFRVGAAVKLRGIKRPVGGCNVENASFGGTICAERVAMTAAVSLHGKIDPEFIVVVTSAQEPTVPCALCLQTLAEFCADDFVVYCANETGLLAKFTLRELLPYPFRAFEEDSK